MGQANKRGSYEQRIAQSKERAESLKQELAQLSIEEEKSAKAKEEMTKQMIAWHLKYPEYKTDTQ